MNNNTVASNNQPTTVTQSRGAGIYADPVNGATATGGNNIIYYNQAHSNPDVYGNVSFTYSCIPDSLPGSGNITSNPQFVSQQYLQYNLQATSPCIDTGNPNPIYNDPDSTRADMGALYFPQVGNHQVPKLVDDLVARKLGNNIYLSWSAVTQDTSGIPLIVDYYRIYRSSNPWFTPSNENMVDSTSATLFIDTISNQTVGYYKVTAVSE